MRTQHRVGEARTMVADHGPRVGEDAYGLCRRLVAAVYVDLATSGGAERGYELLLDTCLDRGRIVGHHALHEAHTTRFRVYLDAWHEDAAAAPAGDEDHRAPLHAPLHARPRGRPYSGGEPRHVARLGGEGPRATAEVATQQRLRAAWSG